MSPFDDADPLAGRSSAAPPPPPSARLRQRGGPGARRRARRVGGDLDHVVMRALEADPARRYPSVEQLARDLDRHLRGLPLESRGGALYRLRKRAHRHWRGLAAAAVLLLLGVLLLGQTLNRQRLELERQRLELGRQEDELARLELARESRRVTALSHDLSDYLIDTFLEADVGRSGERSAALERVLDRGAELLANGAERRVLADEPLPRAALLGAIGQVYRGRDLPAKAEPLLRECLALRRELLPPGHEAIGVAANNLALALRALGRYGEARELLREARDILETRHGGDDPELAGLLSNLAGTEKELGNHPAAIELFRESLAMKRRLPEDFGPAAVASAVKNYGTGLRAAGRLDEAETAFREALALLDRAGDVGSLRRAKVEQHLGSLLRQRGQLASSRPLLEQALRANLGRRSPDHRDVVTLEYELALLEAREGRISSAASRLRRVVEARRARLGDGHPDVVEARAALAALESQ